MQIDTRRFGTIEVADDNTLEVPHGIPGFRQMRRVVLMGAGAAPGHGPEAEHTMYWLQDLDDGDLAFMCVVPWSLFPDYDLEIDENSLGIDDEADVRILSLVTVRRGDGVVQMSANLRAPIVVDTAAQRVYQVILNDSRWSVAAPFATSVPAAATPAEVG